MRSITIEIPGPNAAPRAVASPKTTDAVVRNEKGVTSARQLWYGGSKCEYEMQLG